MNRVRCHEQIRPVQAAIFEVGRRGERPASRPALSMSNVLLCLAAALPLLGCGPSDPLRNAQERGRRGDPTGAIAVLDKVIAGDPQNNSAFYLRGEARLQKGDLPGADADFIRAMEIHPDDPWPHYKRGDVALRRGTPPAALIGADGFLMLRPNSEQGWLLRGRVRLAMKNFSGAIEDFTRLVEPGQDAAGRVDFLKGVEIGEAHRLLLDAWVGKGDRDGIMAEIDAALHRGRIQAWRLYERRAILHRAEGSLQAALDDYVRASQESAVNATSVPGGRDTQIPRLLIARAELKAALGDPAGAVRDYHRALHCRPPDRLAVLRPLVDLELRLEQHGMLFLHAGELAKLDPTDVQAHTALGVSAAEQGWTGSALASLDSARELGGPTPLAAYGRGLAEYNLGRFGDARRSLTDFLDSGKAGRRQAGEAGFRLVLIDLHEGRGPEPARARARELRAKLSPTGSARLIFDFLCGEVPEEKFLKAATAHKPVPPDTYVDWPAKYVAAVVRRASGDTAGAVELYRACVAKSATGGFVLSPASRRELAELEPSGGKPAGR